MDPLPAMHVAQSATSCHPCCSCMHAVRTKQGPGACKRLTSPALSCCANLACLQVTLSNNSKYPAQLRGAEPDKDLAIIKIDAPAAELAPIEVGVSSKLVVGQKVGGSCLTPGCLAACLLPASQAQAVGNSLIPV